MITPITRSEHRRQSVLDSALELLLEFGVSRTSMEELARHAGISRATLYRQFSDRTALLEAVILREAQRAAMDIEQRMAHMPMATRGREGLFLMIRTAVHHPLLKRLLQVDAALVLPALTTEGRDNLLWAQAYATAMIQQLQSLGQATAGEPADVAELLLRLMHSWVLTPPGHVDVRDDDNLRSYIDRFLWPLLTQPAATNDTGTGAQR